MLNTPNNLSFKFGAKFVEIDKKLTLSWSAINALTDRVNNSSAFDVDEKLDELSSRITVNTEGIAELVSTKANTSYVNNGIGELTTRVTVNEGNISSLDTALNALTTRVTENEETTAKNSTWINNLVSSVTPGLTSDSFDNFYKYLFDMIYPIGSIYTTVTETPPPNMITNSSSLSPDSDFSPTIDTTDTYWNGRLSTWKLLETGYFLRNLGDDESEKLGTTGGSTNIARHTHTVTGKSEMLYGPVIHEPDVITYGLFNASSDNRIIRAGNKDINQTTYPQGLYVTGKIDENNIYYSTITFDPTKITIADMDAAAHPEEQIPPYQYVYMYQRVK